MRGTVSMMFAGNAQRYAIGATKRHLNGTGAATQEVAGIKNATSFAPELPAVSLKADCGVGNLELEMLVVRHSRTPNQFDAIARSAITWP